MGNERVLLTVLRGVDLVRDFETRVERVRAVSHVTLEAGAGDMVCVVGASGSGKSTLLNLLSGLDVPTSGEVHILDTLLSGANERERALFRLRHIGVVFQEHNLLQELTAEQNVMLPLRASGWGARQARSEALACLDRAAVGALAGRLPRDMSGGQRQRVGIARALAGGRALIVADEPTGALDSRTSQHIFALLRDLSAGGVTIVVASHDPIAREHATRTAMMVDGVLSE